MNLFCKYEDDRIDGISDMKSNTDTDDVNKIHFGRSNKRHLFIFFTISMITMFIVFSVAFIFGSGVALTIVGFIAMAILCITNIM